MTNRGLSRVCGGTDVAPRGQVFDQGLSPRVRGNRISISHELDFIGSIPACAGEPQSSSPAKRAQKVYPRVCGGTWTTTEKLARMMGLSPRVRGNPSSARRRSG